MQHRSGIQFRETMSGPMMAGETDYRQGEQRAGDEPRHQLAMHATVYIDDLERFIADPNHTGSLEGTIDYPPMGEAIPCHSGRFNLFLPDDGNTKLMIYELAFEQGGAPYYLAGFKEVRDDPGFDLWHDTTTLFTRLHRGSDSDGEIVAAGVLSLGVTELVRLVASMEAPGAGSLADKAEALGRFGHFFLGELWDSYAGTSS